MTFIIYLFRTPATTLRVRVGEYNIKEISEVLPHEEYSVRRKVVNENYEPATYRHDIALLELSHPVRYRKHIVPVCLPEKSVNVTGRMATVTGWGRTSYGMYSSITPVYIHFFVKINI